MSSLTSITTFPHKTFVDSEVGWGCYAAEKELYRALEAKFRIQGLSKGTGPRK